MGVGLRRGVCAAAAAAAVLTLLADRAPASAQTALLDALSSRVTLARAGTLDEVTGERVIRSGDTVATDHGGRAVITYPDGSTAVLDGDSELTIEFARKSAGDYVVRMQQTLGRVWYVVTKTVVSGGRYEVRSAGVALVIRAGSGSFISLSGAEATVLAAEAAIDTRAGAADATAPNVEPTILSTTSATPLAPKPAPGVTVPSANGPRPSTDSAAVTALVAAVIPPGANARTSSEPSDVKRQAALQSWTSTARASGPGSGELRPKSDARSGTASYPKRDAKEPPKAGG